MIRSFSNALGFGRPAIAAASVQEVRERLSGDDAVLIDVRTPAEYAAGHAPKARSIPLAVLPVRIDDLADVQDKTVYLICRSGGRSAQATSLLTRRGFNAVNVTGGTSAWASAGFPLAH